MINLEALRECLPPQIYLELHYHVLDLCMAFIPILFSHNGEEYNKKFLNPEGDLDHRKNLENFSLGHGPYFHKISIKLIEKYERYRLDKQTDTGEYITSG